MGSNGIYGVSGSGLDIESMVKVGMMGKQNEYDKMQQKFTVNEWTKEKYLETYGTLMTFNNSTLSQYKMSSNMNARSAHSSNELALSAAANATAANMTHYVEVQGLASAAYLIGAHGDNGVKTHNVGSTESIKLADALFASVAEGSQVTDIINNRVTTYSKIVADGKEFNPNDIAFQFSVGDGVTGITNSNPEVVSVSAAIGAEKGTHTVTVNKETASVSLNSVDLTRITHYDDVGIANDSTESNEEFDEQIKNIAFKYKSTGADDSTITFGNLNYITDRDDFVTMMINQYPDELRRIIPNFENLDVSRCENMSFAFWGMNMDANTTSNIKETTADGTFDYTDSYDHNPVIWSGHGTWKQNGSNVTFVWDGNPMVQAGYTVTVPVKSSTSFGTSGADLFKKV